MMEVIASKRVMQQSLFADQAVGTPEADVVASPLSSKSSRLITYGLPGAALLLAVIALAVALLK